MDHASRYAGPALAAALLLAAGVGLGVLVAGGERQASPVHAGAGSADVSPAPAPGTGEEPAPTPDATLPAPGMMQIEHSDAGLTVLAHGVRRGTLLRALGRQLDFVVVDEARHDPKVDVLARDDDLQHVLALILADAPHTLFYERRADGVVALQRVVVAADATGVAGSPRTADEDASRSRADASVSWREQVEAALGDRARPPRARLTGEELERARQRRASRQPGLHADRLASIRSEDPAVRAGAASRLDTEDPEELGALAEVLLRDPSARVRMRAARQLGFGDPVRTLPLLDQALADGDPDVVIEVIDAIEFLQDPTGVDKLKPLLTHPDPRVRSAAADAIDMLR